MNDSRFDSLTRAVAQAGSSRVSRRTVLGAGAPLAVAAGLGISRNAAAQQGTPTAPGPLKQRQPGGPSIADKAFALEYDLAKIFRFVADEVRYEVYSGALRGATGTLYGLAGNSVDKALLLAALLQEAMIEVRFATGELDATPAKLLGDAAKMDVDLIKSETARSLASGSDMPTTTSADIPDDVAAFLETLPAKRGQLVTTIRDQVTATVDLIQATLSDSDIALAPVSGQPLAEQQHVWVQYAAGTDWADLDPTIPAAEAGIRYATLADTMSALPDDLFHLVSFRLIGESAVGAAVTRKDLLTHEARVADLVAVPITLVHTKPGAFKAAGIAIVGLIEGSTQYIPNLIVGADTIAGSIVGFDLGGSALSDAKNAGDTLGEWLEVTIRTPGEPDRIVTRTVFDRVDPAVRLAGTIDSATIPPIELDTIPGLGDVFLPLEGVAAIAVSSGIVPLAYFNQDYATPDAVSDMAGVPVAYQMLRTSVSAEMAEQTGSHFYFDRGNVTALWVTPNAVTVDSIHHSVSIDLMHQSFAAGAVTGVRADVPAGLAAGALGHAVERAILESDITYPGAPVLQTATSAGRVFALAQSTGVPILALQPDQPIPASVVISDRARLLIQDEMVAGNIVIVPEKPVDLDGVALTGWWSLDPVTGRLTDLLETGRAAAAADYILIVINDVQYRITFMRLGLCIASIALLADVALAVFGGGLAAVNGESFTALLAGAAGGAAGTLYFSALAGCAG